MRTATGRLRDRIPGWLIRLFPLLDLLGATLLLLSLVFAKFFTNPFAYFAADHSELYFPWWVFINQTVRSGGFPLLNRFWFAGSLPFAAIETGVFYPPNLLFQLLFDARRNLDQAYYFFFASLILHYLLASVAFYLLMTVGLRLRRFAALFGSLVFCCSGSFIGRFVHPLLLMNLAWVPLLYLFYLLFLRHRQLIYALGASAVLALIVAAGHPQMVYYTFLVFGFTALCASIAERVDRPLVFAFSVFIMVVGVLLVAQKVFLGVELASNIVRVGGSAESSESLFNSLHPLYYLTLFAPYLYGRHGVGYWGSEYPWGNWENFLYIGLLPILCVPFCLFWRNRRILAVFGSGLALSVLIALGRFSALSAFLNRRLPFASSLGYLSKITVLFHFFLVVLATVGFHELCAPDRRKRRLAAAVAGAGFLLLFVVLTAERAGKLAPNGFGPPTEVARAFAMHSVALARFLFALIVAVFGVPLMLGWRGALRLVLPLYAVDLVLTVSAFNPIDASMGRASARFGPTALTQRIQQDPGLYRVQNLTPVNLNMVAEIETTYGYHTVSTQAYSRIMGSLGPEFRGLLDLLGVKYYAVQIDLGPLGFVPFGDGLWRNPSPMDRVTFLTAFQRVPGLEDMRRRVLDKRFDPRQAVLLDDSVALPPGFRLPAEAPAARTATKVHIDDYSATRVRASLDAPSAGMLLFSELQYPGWEARLDGRPASLLPADLSFYALPVGPGRHRVEFRFRSKPLIYGLAIAGLTACLSMLLLALPRTRPFFLVPFSEWNRRTGSGSPAP